MTIAVSKLAILGLHGRITKKEAFAIREHIRHEILTGRIAGAILDCAKVTQMSRSGGVMIRDMAIECESSEQELHLVRVPPTLKARCKEVGLQPFIDGVRPLRGSLSKRTKLPDERSGVDSTWPTVRHFDTSAWASDRHINNRVLIVDPNEDNRIVYSTMLRHFGYSVVESTEWPRLVEHASSLRPDLIVMEISLPETSGWEIAEALLRDPRTSQIPLLALTHLALYSERVRAESMGFSGYLTKPCQPRDFIAEVRRVIPIRSGETDEREVGITEVDGRLRIVQLEKDGTYRYIDGSEKLHDLLYVSVTGSSDLKRDVAELEALINDAKVHEQQLHAFFEAHPDFILNDEYRRAHSKIVLSRDAPNGPLIPDFMLEPAYGPPLGDLLELKLPQAKVMRISKNRPRFSAAVMEAVAQLREYSTYFEDTAHRERIRVENGLTAYRPRMIVLIGRRGGEDPVTLRRVQDDVPRVLVRTYDDVLEIIRARFKRGRRE